MDAVAKRLACSRDVEAVCRVCIPPNAICAHRERDADDDYCTRTRDVQDEYCAWPWPQEIGTKPTRERNGSEQTGSESTVDDCSLGCHEQP